MKAKWVHRIPLGEREVKLREEAKSLGEGSGLVFPLRSGSPILTSTLPKMPQYGGIPAVPHIFRSSFRDWAADETHRPRKVIKAALAHVFRTRWTAPQLGRTSSSEGG